MSDAQVELGPSLPSRQAVYAQAVELSALARLAIDCALPGSHCDVPRALKQFEKMRAILGEGDG